MRLVYYIDVTMWVLLTAFGLKRWNHSPLDTALLAVSIVSFVFWMTARHQLGASFKIKAEAHQLVRTGLYSKIRNPIYFFAFIALGTAVAALHAWIVLAVFVAVYTFQIPRIKQEEEVLEEAFGEEYRAYKRQTWF